jgi:two-component sensor histidine kinase
MQHSRGINNFALSSSFNKRLNAKAPQVSVPQALKIHPDQAVLCGLILNELLTNALKYGVNSAEDQISVVVTPGLDHQITIAVGNDGDRLPPDFDLESIQSIGLQLVMNLVEQLNGTLQLDRKDRTIFEVRFRSAI